MRDRELAQAKEIARLLFLEMRDELTPEERQRLNEWRYSQDKETQEFFEEITEWSHIEADLRAFYGTNSHAALSRIKKEIAAEEAATAAAGEPQAEVTPIRTIPWFRRYRVAAAIVFLVVASTLFMLYRVIHENRKTTIQNIPETAEERNKFKNDVAPGGDKAILTLADGSKIALNDASSGELAKQGATRVVKTSEGQVTYTSQSNLESLVSFNTIATPRGGQYQVLLPDGSKVWLNAASSLRFPTAFTGKERNVELTGEAYFEIANQPSMPFKVSIAGNGVTGNGSSPLQVEVLGTEFNIKAYIEDGAPKATLINGSIRATASNGRQATLHPGEQAIASHGSLQIMPQVDTAEIVAWKEGNFSFEGTSLEETLRQLARWYDVDIRYESNKPGKPFTAKLSRENNLSDVLHVLELCGYDFDIDGRTIVVK